MMTHSPTDSASGLPASPLSRLDVAFLGSFPDPGVHLDPVLPEVAFVGRSNVGKSSLLNALVGRKGLARVSGTPGKTTLLNVYRLPDFYLVDLPGYGYARADKAQRAGFRQLLDSYVAARETLAGVVWLLDIRHDPSEEDLEMRESLAAVGSPVLVVLTKADKLGRTARQTQVTALARALGLPEDQLQPTSIRTGDGIADLGASILAVVAKGPDA
jgi:GTP-binding protein